jgi:REP element-mobilizing transposase RayT
MKPGTYTQIYLHFVFVVSHREYLIHEKHQSEIYSFITGLINSMGHKSLAVNGMPDHVHVFMGFNPDKSPSETVKEIKRATTNFINSQSWFRGKFKWQSGYGGFSYSRSQIGNVISYIINQKEHHKKQSFKDEYLEMLRKFEIDFDERYLFDFLE